MDFEEVKKSWQTQHIRPITDIGDFVFALQSRWQRHQRQILRMNICMSIGFIGAMLGIGWVYITFHNQYNWPFKASIFAVYCLMIVFSGVSWRSYAFKKENLEDSSYNYINYQLKKLSWQRKLITGYVWVNNILLWLALMMYLWEITSAATALFRYMMLSITTVYIIAITLWSRIKKQKKQLLTIDKMIADLKDLQTSIIADL